MPLAEPAAGGARGPARVHRADRVRDWIALTLVVIGVLTYGTAHRGMGALARDRTPTTAEASARGEWKMVRWNKYARMSRAGVFLVVVGAAVGVGSCARHAARRRGTANVA